MISALIFTAHLIFAISIFTIKWQKDSLSAGLLNVSLIIILFSVGWSISGQLAKIIMEKEGFGLYFNRDDFSLAVLTVLETAFYRLYYGKEKTIEDDMEKQ